MSVAGRIKAIEKVVYDRTHDTQLREAAQLSLDIQTALSEMDAATLAEAPSMEAEECETPSTTC